MAKQRPAPLDLGGVALQTLTPSNDPAPFAESAGTPPATLAAPPPPDGRTTQTRPRPAGDSDTLVWGSAAAVSALWVAGVVAFAVGLEGATGIAGMSGLEQLALALLAIGPVGLIVFCAVILGQATRLSAQNARASDASERLLSPALLAAAQAGGALQSVRTEIEASAEAADRARSAMGSLAESLSAETRALSEAAEEALRAARQLSDGVARERDQLTALGRRLDDQAAAVSEAVTRQARMVSEAAELAQTQIHEAELGLSARAADLAAAAGEATDAARAAGGDLSRQTQRLETAAGDLADHVRSMETGLTGHRTSLADLGQSLSGEQDAWAARVEAQRRDLGEALTLARSGAEEIGEMSASSGQAVQALVAAAAAQMQDVAEAVRIERDRLELRARDAFGQLGASAEAERERIESGARASIDALVGAAELASRAADQQAEAARSKVEQLSEAAFAAGRQADDAFDNRLSAARRMIDQSASLVDEAGARSNRSLEQGLAATHATLADLDRALAEMDARTATLPQTAMARVEEVRRAVEQGVADLQAAARRAAAETESIDAVFQERVRRNYQTLSEAVRLMGTVGGMPTALAPPVAEPTAGGGFPGAATADVETALGEPGPPRLALRSAFVPEPLETLTSARAADEALFKPAPPEEVDEPAVSAPPQPTPAAPQRFAMSVADAGLRPRIRYYDAAEATARNDPGGAATMTFGPSAAEAPAATAADARAVEALLEPEAEAAKDAAADAPPAEATPERVEADTALFEPQAAETPEPPPPARAPAPRGMAPGRAGAWTWRDLLKSVGEDPCVDEEALADRLATELLAMSVDADRLLPRGRVEEIVAPVHAGDREAARDMTRKLAPAAIRRLSRRLATDTVLRGDAARFVDRYATQLADASRGDQAGETTRTLLGSEAGRVWLLFDAVEGA